MYVYPKHHTERDIRSLVAFVLYVNHFSSLMSLEGKSGKNVSYKSRYLFHIF